MKNTLIFLALFFSIVSNLKAQELIKFNAANGLEITANLYEIDSTLPYLLLFHQARYSKGEYRETAIKLLKLDYNVIAVDLRSGNKVNFISNETAILARSSGKSTEFIDTEQDIIAAIDYAYYKSNKEVVILGSSFSASLCLKIAVTNPKVKAVVAFSPGEYFMPELEIKQEIKSIQKPIFVAVCQQELSYTMELLSLVDNKQKMLFSPKNGKGEHGSKALWKTNNTNKEYWLALMIFFKKL